ncbi:MAG: phosphotransferase [Firmicutes bacterium]|nr:phosphotransferase [Bacillota bacterium]
MARCPEWADLPLGEMLAEYGLFVKAWKEVSSCLKVEAAQGLFRLKCFAYPQEEFPFIYRLMQYLEQRGFRHPEKMRLTSRGKLGLSIAGRFYYLASWQEGTTNFELGSETLLQIGSLLGSLHAASRGFPAGETIHPARVQWGAWPAKLTARYQDLRQFLEMAQRGVTPFDRLFFQQEKVLLAAAEGSLQRLKQLPYQEIVNRDRQAKFVCHRDCIPRNVVRRPDGEFALIDFDNAAHAERIDDLAKLLRTFSDWQLERARYLLRGYGQWFPVEEEEIRLIEAFLEFPMEYWQLGRISYQRGRPHLRALQKRLAVDQAKGEFLRNLVEIQRG